LIGLVPLDCFFLFFFKLFLWFPFVQIKRISRNYLLFYLKRYLAFERYLCLYLWEKENHECYLCRWIAGSSFPAQLHFVYSLDGSTRTLNMLEWEKTISNLLWSQSFSPPFLCWALPLLLFLPEFPRLAIVLSAATFICSEIRVFGLLNLSK
jgi:hypothetical protein